MRLSKPIQYQSISPCSAVLTLHRYEVVRLTLERWCKILQELCCDLIRCTTMPHGSIQGSHDRCENAARPIPISLHFRTVHTNFWDQSVEQEQPRLGQIKKGQRWQERQGSIPGSSQACKSYSAMSASSDAASGISISLLPCYLPGLWFLLYRCWCWFLDSRAEWFQSCWWPGVIIAFYCRESWWRRVSSWKLLLNLIYWNLFRIVQILATS